MTHISHEKLQDYTDGSLNDDENKLIESHLSTCAECNQLQLLLENLHMEWENPSIDSPVNLTKDIMKQISTPRKNNSIYIHLALASVATIIFSLFQMDQRLIESSNKVVDLSHQSIQYTKDSIDEGIQYLKDFDFEKIGGIIYEETN